MRRLMICRIANLQEQISSQNRQPGLLKSIERLLQHVYGGKWKGIISSNDFGCLDTRARGCNVCFANKPSFDFGAKVGRVQSTKRERRESISVRPNIHQ